MLSDAELEQALAFARVCDALADACSSGSWLRALRLARRLASLRRVAPHCVSYAALVLREAAAAVDRRGGDPVTMLEHLQRYRWSGSIGARIPTFRAAMDSWPIPDSPTPAERPSRK